MTDGPANPVQSFGLSAPRASLLSAATVKQNSSDQFANGVEWQKWTVDDPGLYDASGAISIPDPDPDETELERGAFAVIAPVKHGTAGANFQELQTRALAKLKATFPFYVEEQFFSDSLSLTDAHPVDGGSPDAVTMTGGWAHGLAMMEDAIAVNSLGAYQAVIHVQPSALTKLVAADVVRRVGNTYLTATDNIVVAGRGYDSAEVDEIFATGPVHIEHGPPLVSPTVESESLDRQTNDYRVYAQQLAIATWDPDLLHLKGTVTAPATILG